MLLLGGITSYEDGRRVPLGDIKLFIHIKYARRHQVKIKLIQKPTVISDNGSIPGR